MAEKHLMAVIRLATSFSPKPDVVQLTPARLLLGVIASDDPLVGDALEVSGASPGDLQVALRYRLATEAPDVVSSTHTELLTRGLKLTLPSTTRRVLESAGTEAAKLEHHDVESGHLLLVWARDRGLDGHRELLTAGADADRLVGALTQRLPGVAPVFQARIEAALQLPRLSDAEAQVLIRRVERTPATEHADAFETLLERHLFLAWEPAANAARQGHRLEYCCSITTNAVLRGCLNADKAQGTFSTWLLAHIERSLEIHLKDAPKETL